MADRLWRAIHKSLPDRLRLIQARDAAPPPRVVSREDEFGQSGSGRSLPGPGAPIIYNQSDELPRLYDYNYASNKIISPRGEYAVLPSFFHLYMFYLNNDEVKVCNRWNTNQLLSVKKDVNPRKGKRRSDADFMSRWEAARRLVEYPDPGLDWSYEQWMRAVLQEKSITDAVTVYPLKTFGGEIVSWQLIDGQTIKPILSYQGGRPLPPAPAYVQYIKGYPFKPFDLNSLVYAPASPRVWCAYGESRVEELLTSLAALTLFANYTNDWFTEGNIPEAMMTLPESYFKGEGTAVAKRVANYQQILDEQSGVSPTRRRFHIPPVPADKITLLKQLEFKWELPEWYVRKLCIQWGCPPSLFASSTNRSTAQQTSVDLGDSVFRADLMWIKRLVDRLLAMSGFGDFELTLRPTRSFKMVEVQGFILAASTPLPIAPDNKKGLPAMSRSELRNALDLETQDAGDLEGPGGSYDDEDDAVPETPEPATAPAEPSAAPEQAPATQLPSSTPPPPKAAAGTIPAKPAIQRARVPVAAGDKAREYHTMAERSRLTAKMLGAVRPMLAEKGRKVIEQAKRAAAARHKKVV